MRREGEAATNTGAVEAGRGSAPLPLRGVRVVDLSQNLAGPLATQILGDLGAEITKVEPPGGDPARGWGPPFWGGDSPLFLCANRNKRSGMLDLNTPAGREELEDLVSGADVFVQAFRAGVVERLGFGPDRLRRQNPALIYVSVTAYGPAGPHRDLPGYDPLMQAYGGLMSVTGEAGGRPARAGTSVVDMGTGMWTALGVLAALRERDRTGVGAHVVTSLLETAVTWMSYHIQGHLATGEVPRPMGSGLGMIAPYEAFPVSDAHVMIAAGNDGLFRRLCDALELPGLAGDPRFGTNADRVAHREILTRHIGERTRSFTAGDLLDRLREAGVPAAPIHDVGEVVRDEQVRATGILRQVPGSSIDGYTDVGMPVTFDGHRPPARLPPPGRPGKA